MFDGRSLLSRDGCHSKFGFLGYRKTEPSAKSSPTSRGRSPLLHSDAPRDHVVAWILGKKRVPSVSKIVVQPSE
jgi:hypothetical protein